MGNGRYLIKELDSGIDTMMSDEERKAVSYYDGCRGEM